MVSESLRTEILSISGKPYHDKNVNNADFETAISATKFGKFNILLMILATPPGWTFMFENTTMSYVFPAAQCDLDLSLNEKGTLNAVTFLGMVSSSFIWGFLCDTLGRKTLMVVGFFLDALCVLASSFSQSFIMLVTLKFFGGFIINGPFAALTTYLSEFHCSKYRARIQMVRGLIVSCGTMILPLLAWGILPQEINIRLFNNSIVLYSWNIYLMACAMPSLIGAIVYTFMPESPKFLMMIGRTEEALAVFKKVYRMNTGKSEDEFPIKGLIDESHGHISANRSKVQALKEGLQQVKPLCLPPHVKMIILVCIFQSFIMLSVNTIRLWLPQIFQTISDYEYHHNDTTASLCTMLEIIDPSEEAVGTCFFKFSPSVYMNTMIISTVMMSGYVVAGFFINRLGKKLLLGVLSICAGLLVLSIYFAQNTATVLTLASLFITFGTICGNVIVTVAIDLFPTSLRTLSVSLAIMSGTLASMIGNFVFPFLLKMGCAPPFVSIGAVMIGCSLLVVLLPNTEQKALQ